MGIDIAGKKTLETVFGWPEMSSEAAANISVVIDDISLNLRRILAGVTSWEELGARVRDRVEVLAKRDNLKEYWALWDESKFVPPSKHVTQQKRAERAAAPFTEAEQSKITIGHGPIPEPSSDFFQRLMATRSMHASLYMFITAELATTVLPDGVSLYLDGVRAQGIVTRMLAVEARCNHAHPQPCDNENCTYAVEFANIRVPKSEFEVPSDIIRGRLERPSILHIVRHGAGKKNSIYINESRQVGESDLKIPAIIADQEAGRQIFIRSCDTDMLVIMLLHMRNYVCMDKEGDGDIPYHMCKYGLFIDTNGPLKPGTPSAPILDLVALWRNVHREFQTRYVTVRFGPETLAVIMLISGSDYADRLRQIGPASVWKAFADSTGHSLLFPPNMTSKPGVIIDDVCGQPHARISIALEEGRMFRFIAFMYHQIALRQTPFSLAGSDTLAKVRAKRRQDMKALVKKGTPLTTRNSWEPAGDAEIMAAIRRLHWNADYFLNGSKKTPFMDPTYTDPGSGMSVHGWRVGAEKGKVERAESVLQT